MNVLDFIRLATERAQQTDDYSDPEFHALAKEIRAVMEKKEARLNKAHAEKGALAWNDVRLLIMANTATGTITEFACDLGKSTQALRDAVRGKAPRVLARMKARLGNFTTK